MAQHSTLLTTTHHKKKENKLARGMLANLKNTAGDAQGMPITTNNQPETHRECPSPPPINKEDAAATNASPSRITLKNETKDYSATPITTREIDPEGHQAAKGPSPTACNNDDEQCNGGYGSP